MAIKAVVETLEGVDEAYHSLYTERDGKFEITGVEGMKTAADTDRLSKALKSERDVSAGHKAKLAAFGDHTPDTIEDLQSRFDDAELRLEAAGGDKGPDKEALDKLVETRAGVRIKPLERQFAKLQKEFDTVTGERNALAKERSRNTVVSAVERAAQAKNVGVQKEVLASGDIASWGERTFEVVDGAVVTREGIPGITSGISPESAFGDIKEDNSRPYWFGATVGGGASGGSGGGGSGEENPFGINKATGTPNNLTEAGRILRTDRARAALLFKAAGKASEPFFPMLVS